MNQRRKIYIIAGVVMLIALVGGAAVAVTGDSGSSVATAVDDDDLAPGDADEDAAEGPDVPISGPALERASAAALDHLGEGRVTATEVGDEESYYEVEVTLNNGSEVDVQVDESFIVVGTD